MEIGPEGGQGPIWRAESVERERERETHTHTQRKERQFLWGEGAGIMFALYSGENGIPRLFH
jgi:hypothetical protein